MPIIGLTKTVEPTFEPVDIEEARLHCRVNIDEDDSLIASLITAARQYCEDETLRQFITATYRMTLDRFPDAWNGIRPDRASVYFQDQSGILWGRTDGVTVIPPRPRLIGVTSIVYLASADGASTTLSSANYRVDTNCEPGRITPAYGLTWPATRDVIGAVSITYTAGYGATAATVPQAIKQAMLLLIGHWYQNREAVTLSQIPAAIQFAVDALLSPYRVMEYR